jgi:hypothetical protein
VPGALGSPTRPHTDAGLHPRLLAGIDGMKHGGIGAVELNQRPRERAMQRVIGPRFGDPAPCGDRARGADLDELV